MDGCVDAVLGIIRRDGVTLFQSGCDTHNHCNVLESRAWNIHSLITQLVIQDGVGQASQ